jgi:hypothetical protein
MDPEDTPQTETPPSAQAEVVEDEPQPQEAITQPAKLLRIATMVRELLDETRQASLDEPGRLRLREIYERSVGELEEVLSPDLKEELASLAPPMQGVPSESEIRVAQAQLVGWLEGLFHGIQTALFAQQMAARAQFEQMRRAAITAEPEPARQPGPDGHRRGGTSGPYL